MIQKGVFYRLESPFENNIAAWMVVSQDKNAIVGYYKILSDVNCHFRRLKLYGLNEDMLYKVEGLETSHYGDELMSLGLITNDPSAGQVIDDSSTCTDFWSKIFILKA